jgi:hypothetical protein
MLPRGSGGASDGRALLGNTASRKPATGAVLHPVPPSDAKNKVSEKTIRMTG